MGGGVIIYLYPDSNVSETAIAAMMNFAYNMYFEISCSNFVWPNLSECSFIALFLPMWSSIQSQEAGQV